MFAALTSTPASLNADADAVETVRILMVGNAGCGKSTLAHALATGKPPARPPPQTAGCTVLVRMIDADGDPAAPSSSGRPLAVELWDVGAARRYAPLRRLFYGGADAHGVLLCHDLASAGGGVVGGGPSQTAAEARAASVRPWVAELAACLSGGGSGGLGGAAAAPATPSSPPPSLAGLPFPAAVVGTKADRAGDGRKGGRPPAFVDAVALGLSGGGWGAAASRAWRGLGMSRAASFTRRWSGGGGADAAANSRSSAGASGASPPPVRPGLTSMATAALLGDVDAPAFDDFFRRCAAAARRGGGVGPGAGGGGSASAAWGAAYGVGGGGSAVGVADGLGGDDDDLV